MSVVIRREPPRFGCLMPCNAQQCACAGCSKTTDERRFGERRHIDASLQSPLLKPVPHSNVFCNHHGCAATDWTEEGDSAQCGIQRALRASTRDAVHSAREGRWALRDAGSTSGRSAVCAMESRSRRGGSGGERGMRWAEQLIH